MDNWLQQVLALGPGAVTDVAKVVTMLGDPAIVLLLVVAVTWKRWMRMSVCLAGAFMVRIVYTVLKQVIGRNRPDAALQVVHASGYAMPSGHAAGAAFVAVLVVLLHPRWRFHAIAAAFVVGWSRIALGVHFPSDVAVGWVIGASIGWATLRTSFRFERNTIGG